MLGVLILCIFLAFLFIALADTGAWVILIVFAILYLNINNKKRRV